MMSSLASSRVLIGCLMLTAVLAVPLRADAQNRLGGHFGMLFPLVDHVGGETTTIGDDFKIGFPMGVTVKASENGRSIWNWCR